MLLCYDTRVAWTPRSPEARGRVRLPLLMRRLLSEVLLTFIRVKVTFIDKDGDRHDFQVAEGDNLLDIAQANDLEMEGSLHPCSVAMMSFIFMVY